MPPINDNNIKYSLSEVNGITGETLEIESTTTPIRMGSPRVTWAVDDLSEYFELTTNYGTSDMLYWRCGYPNEPISSIYDIKSKDPKEQYKEIDLKYPGLLRKLSAIVDSRIAEAGGVSLDIDKQHQIIGTISIDCLSLIEITLGLPNTSTVFRNPIGIIILSWITDITNKIKNGIILPKYRLGPEITDTLSNIKMSRSRSIVVFKGNT